MAIGSVNFGGLASGIDSRALIDAILNVERRPINRLQVRQLDLDDKKDAYDTLRSKLSDYQSKLKSLSSQSTFIGRTATIGNEELFTATAAPGADLGSFTVEVLALAAANKVKSDGFSASDQGLISDGTITLQSGTHDLISIDVSAAAGNNSLTAVRDAINDADAGVAASILFDGNQYQLIVRSKESGLDNALAITDTTDLNLDDGGNEVTAASDARLLIDGISVTSADNSVSGAIAGVTLNLLKADVGVETTLDVAADVDGSIEAVESLVESYNDVISFFNEQFNRDDPGALATDSFARRVRNNVQTLVTSGVEGIPIGEIRSLASIGVSFDGRSGEASVDAATLRGLLEERFDDVARLFQTSGSASDAQVDYLDDDSSTVSGEYAVSISQAAEQATVAGSEAIKSQGLKKDETLTILAGGETSVVDLKKNDKIDEIVDKINAQLAADGVAAQAIDDGGFLRISSDGYGSDQDVSVTSDLNDPGNGRQTGFSQTAALDNGEDVAGTIGGIAATGAGRILTVTGEGDPAGLSIIVKASSADVIAKGGDFGTVSYSTGLTKRLTASLAEITQFGDGQIDSAKKIIDGQLDSISDEIRRIEERLVSREARLVQAFAAAEQAIATLQSQQAQLGSFFPS